ncbi:MAG TPA: NADH-quinone oxidoreductase subunit H [Methanoculleus sp.]|nr:NADH-quinone oxidoreductase subunit H [Methanoculleus sp.]
MLSNVMAAVIGCVGIAAYGMVVGLFLQGVDRKCAAHMQARVGPPIRQPFIDIGKLLCKDNVVPDHAVRAVFNAAPLIALAASITILLYLPLGSIMPVLGEWGDVVLIMYLLTVPGLAMMAGGFASGSPYATVGSQREMVTMIAYEFPLATGIIAIAWRLSAAGIADPFLIATIARTPVWSVTGPLGWLGLLLLLIVLAWVTPAELSRVPCDTPEAETELAGGLLVEYSGRNLALFSLSLAVKTVAMATLAVVLFLPWNPSWYIELEPLAALIVDVLFFIIKLVLVVFFSVSVIRVMMARFRINHLVTLYWKYLGIAGIAGLALIVLDATLGMGVVV